MPAGLSTGPFGVLPDQGLRNLNEGVTVDAIPGETGGGQSRNEFFNLGITETRNQ